MKKRMISLILSLTLLLSLSVPTFAVAPTTQPHFTDVPTSHWAYTQIERACSDGVIAGTAGNAANYTGVFSPSGTLTEAQFVTIMTRAFFNEELEAAKKAVGSNAKWYAAAQKVAEDQHLLTFVQGKMDAPITRYDMAAIMTNIMSAKEFPSRPDVTEIEETYNKIADFKSIPNSYQVSVASVFAMGLIAGTDSKGTFSGASYMNRAQAAIVYGRMKDAFLNAGDGSTTTKPDTTEPTPTPTPSTPTGGDGKSSIVGTTSSQPVTLSYATHKPVDDYWSNQSEAVKAATDKDAFNAAVNTLIHVEEISKNSSLWKINPNFNYAVYAENSTTDEIKNTTAAFGSIFAYGSRLCATKANGVYVCNAYSMSDKEIAAVAEATNKFTAGMSDKEKIKICVDLITQKFSYDANGGGFSWTSGGTAGVCDDFSIATRTILGVAGIPVFSLTGDVSNGPHAWNMAYADGEWVIVDATAAEFGYPQCMSMSEHEKLYGYSHSLNTGIYTQIKQALIETAESVRNK